MYSLLTLLFTLILYDLYLIIFENKSRFLNIIIWNVLLFYSHYLSVFVFLMEISLFLIFFRLIKTSLNKILLSIAIVLVSCLPGLMIFFRRSANLGDSWLRIPEYSELYGNILRFFNGTQAFLGCIVLLGLISISLRRTDYKLLLKGFKLKSFQFIFFAFFVPYISMFIVSKVAIPVFLDRYLLFTSVHYIGMGWVSYILLKDTKWFWSLAIVLPMIISLNYLPKTNRNIDEIMTFVMANKTEKTQIYLSPPWIDLLFYYHYDIEKFKNMMRLFQGKLMV